MILKKVKSNWIVATALGAVAQLTTGLISSSAHATMAVGSLGWDTVSYFGLSHSDQDSMFSTIQASWLGYQQGPLFESSAQVQLNAALNRDNYYGAEIPEAYVGTSQRLGPAQLSVGRRKVEWSHLDSRWALGIWQPRYNWDFLAPETVGMSGAFLRVDQPGFQLVAYGSPLFIPERSAPTYHVDTAGSMTSVSPWFIAPPSHIRLFNQSVPVRYNLQIPQINQIVSNAGASVMARVGEKNGLWGSTAYAYKPMNQLLLGYNGGLLINQKVASADLYPRIMYHHLASVEAGYHTRPIDLWFSVLGERPVSDAPSKDISVYQDAAPSLAVSSAVDVDLAGGRGGPRLDVNYIRQWGGDTNDKGTGVKNDSGSNFDSRYPYKNAVSVGLKSDLNLFLGDVGKRLTASSRVLYDISHDGSIFSAELKFKPTNDWVLGLGTDILMSNADSEKSGGMIYRYQANDRVHGGVSYAF